MAIATYTDLQSTVADYLARSDLNSRIPDFITLAEARFNRSLRAREMEIEAPVTLTAGSGPLPVDYLEWHSVVWTGSARTQDLQFHSADSENWRRRYRPNGDPQMYTVKAGKLTIRPVVAGTVTFTYYQKIPPLASNPTNWLLTKSPDLYLYTTLAEAMLYVKDEQRTIQYLQAAKAEMEQAGIEGDSAKLVKRSASYNASQADEANADQNAR